MGITSIALIGIGLAMDAFSVSVCKGLAMDKISWRKALIIGLWFGGFQALMPILGYLLGSTFASKIQAVDHWVAFGLLTLLGLNMIREAIFDRDETETASVGFVEMLLLAIATSIDALAVGITFSMQPDINIWLAVLIIGAETFLISVLGVKIGNVFGSRWSTGAEIVGGCILILIGLHILLKDLGVLSF